MKNGFFFVVKFLIFFITKATGFIIETDGSISNIGLIKGLTYGCDQEAMKVVRLMDKNGYLALSMEFLKDIELHLIKIFPLSGINFDL